MQTYIEDEKGYEHLLNEPCCNCKCRDTTSTNKIGYVCLVNYDLKTSTCEFYRKI